MSYADQARNDSIGSPKPGQSLLWLVLIVALQEFQPRSVMAAFRPFALDRRVEDFDAADPRWRDCVQVDRHLERCELSQEDSVGGLRQSAGG